MGGGNPAHQPLLKPTGSLFGNSSVGKKPSTKAADVGGGDGLFDH